MLCCTDQDKAFPEQAVYTFSHIGIDGNDVDRFLYDDTVKHCSFPDDSSHHTFAYAFGYICGHIIDTDTDTGISLGNCHYGSVRIFSFVLFSSGSNMFCIDIIFLTPLGYCQSAFSALTNFICPFCFDDLLFY